MALLSRRSRRASRLRSSKNLLSARRNGLRSSGDDSDMVDRCDPSRFRSKQSREEFSDYLSLSSLISNIERGDLSDAELATLKLGSDSPAPVLGITGTGGAGKSSLTDEIIRRFRIDSDNSAKIAVLAIDPTRRKTEGLFGDRIRMNSIYDKKIYMRSIATENPLVKFQVT